MTLTMYLSRHFDSSPPIFFDSPSKGTTSRLKTFDDGGQLARLHGFQRRNSRYSSTLRHHLHMHETRILYSLGAQCAARDLMMVSLRHTVKRFWKIQNWLVYPTIGRASLRLLLDDCLRLKPSHSYTPLRLLWVYFRRTNSERGAFPYTFLYRMHRLSLSVVTLSVS